MSEGEPLVSVVIPCFNADRWIEFAVESCLRQTWPNMEIIVIDDGSTDDSLERVKSFRSKIRYESGPNKGGNHARNWGFALSKGKYIQFLDADDYLLSDKIARQVKALESSRADVVYEDWQRLEEQVEATPTLHQPEISGPQSDILEALLGSWAPPPCALLFKRGVIEKVGGWNEQISCAQDWELNVRLALAGSRYVYLPGCHSVYRRPFSTTVSTRNATLMHNTGIGILQEVEVALRASGAFGDKYRRSMAHSYLAVARNYYESDRERFWNLVSEARRLSPSYLYRQNRFYRWAAALFGLDLAERLAMWKRRLNQRRQMERSHESFDRSEGDKTL